MQSLDLMTSNLIQDSIDESDYVLDIDLRDVKPFNIGKLDFCYKEGYLQAINHMSEIKRILKK